jgi:glycogen synthase
VKILLHADAVGGVFTYAVELARALVASGVSVVLATDGAPLAPDQRRTVADVPGLVHHASAFRLEWMDDPWEDVARAGAWLVELARRERPDVVHLNAFAHGALRFPAPTLVVGHSDVLSWFEAVKGEPAPSSWDAYRRAVGAGLRGAGAIAAPSAAMADALVRHHGPMPAPVVIPNGRDPARFPPGEKEPLVLGAGRLWDEAKNAAALARVAREVPWPVCIAGPFEPAPRLEARRSAQGGRPVPPGEATLLGRLSEPELACWLGRAAIFAHPARYEPFGLAVLEAALAGCALVLGDIPSLRENWAGAAELVPPRDDAALAARIRALAADPSWRVALAAAARDRALRLTPARMAAGYLALYRSLVGGGARP